MLILIGVGIFWIIGGLGDIIGGIFSLLGDFMDDLFGW